MLSKDIETAYKNAAKIVKTNIYATIATASLNGEPHVSPVYFSFDEDLRLYWASAVDAKHSKLIEQNPIISLVIFDSTAPERTGNGVYMNGFAEICSGDRLELAIPRHSKRVGKQTMFSAADYLGESPRRIYSFVPSQLWTLLEPRKIAGHLIDTKVELEIERVRNLLQVELNGKVAV